MTNCDVTEGQRNHERRMRQGVADRVLDNAIAAVAGELRGPLKSILKLAGQFRENAQPADPDNSSG